MEINMNRFLIPLFIAPALLTACASTPEPTPEPPVVIKTEPVQTCSSISELQRVVIPAKTKIVYGTNRIENGPYAPIERQEKHIVEVSPEVVYYVDGTGAQVTDICEDQTTG